MARIVLIETSTSLCSTALAVDGSIAEYRESTRPRAHASLTAPFVKEMLDARGMAMADCDAVCVSAGPGSYTGLRVGSSTAKGLCFASGRPLLAVGTLEILARQAIEDGLLPEGCRYIVPMDTMPRIVGEDSFSELLEQGPVLFVGDGAEKCSHAISSPNAHFFQCCPRASAMLVPAERELRAGNFRNTAYFEPFYLKQFQATVSKKKIF